MWKPEARDPWPAQRYLENPMKNKTHYNLLESFIFIGLVLAAICVGVR